MRSNKTGKLVTFKTCPRCHGAGQVPCDGNEHVRQEQRDWAYSFTMKPVAFKCWDGTVVPGVAIPELLPGGYHNLKIYVKMTDPPNQYGYIYKDIGDGKATPIHTVGDVALFSFDIINGKAFWPVTCRYQDRDGLLLEYWPEFLSLENRKLLEIPK